MSKNVINQVQKVFILLPLLLLSGFLAAQTVSMRSFFEAFASKEEAVIEDVLKKLNQDSSLHKAYKGGLLMRKADFQKGPSQKLKMFKEGNLLLEEQIKAQPNNAEYRLIRLIIQENAPKILKYNKEIENDVRVIQEEYARSNNSLKKQIEQYAKRSAHLNL